MMRPLVFLSLLLVALHGARAQQVEVEDLADSELERDAAPSPLQELEEMFAEAEEIFLSREQPQSLPLFSQLIEALEGPAARGELEEEGVRILDDSLSYRAQAAFNLGETERAEEDLRRLIRRTPSYEMDRSLVSSKLLDLFDSVKDDMVGYLEITVSPQDAVVHVGDRTVDVYSGPLALLAGPHRVRAERAGYEPVEQEIDLEAGKTQTLELVLERTSAVLSLMTRPSGASVLIDGRMMGVTEGEAPQGFLPVGEAARYPRQEFSAPLLIGGLDLGHHELEIRLEGHRPFRSSIEVEELTDYHVDPILLEKATGTVVLRNLPEGAVVTANGREVLPERPSGLPPRVELAPDSYRFQVSHGTVGVFETSFDLEDRETIELEVVLRPGLVLLGILGGDRVNAQRLGRGLREQISETGDWALLDRSLEGSELLARLDLDVERFRELRDPAATSRTPDWDDVQELLDRETPGAVYVVGILSDDLMASYADLWIWPAAPGPSRPAVRRVDLEDPEAIASLGRALSPSVTAPTPTLGALLIDSEASTAPVVAHLTPDGPAAQAGLQPGDELVAIGETPVFTVALAREELARLVEERPKVGLEVRRGADTLTLELVLASSIPVVGLEDRDVIYPAVFAALSAEQARPDSRVAPWILELDEAAVLLHSGAYEEAVRLLRRIRAPSAPFGDAMVHYWLGIALGFAGPTYAENARQAFERAAGAEEGRLYHEDGPWVAPRARARLVALGK